jgi:periplasmic protein TonB
VDERRPQPSLPDDVRIVDLVFAGELPGRRRRLAIGAAIAAALYLAIFSLLGRLTESGASFGAELAARVHDAIAAERAVDVTPPPPSPPPPEAPAAPHVAAWPHAASHVRAAARAAPAAPAQAGKLAAASDAPVDFTGTAFVVGSGASYAGGSTTSRGTNRAPVSGAVAPGATGNGNARSRARPVSLDQSEWACPWPPEADARQVNQETVVLRVAVRPDGRAERVEVLEDPGFGFGGQARQCALATRFSPARDEEGRPVAALSAPLRVHFFR